MSKISGVCVGESLVGDGNEVALSSEGVQSAAPGTAANAKARELGSRRLSECPPA